MTRPVKWAYGVTAIPERFHTTLPATLQTLKLAGFDTPTVFVDNYASTINIPFKAVCRYPRIGVYANWLLSLYELYLRNPTAQYFAMFQDDILACRNLKEYIERTIPDRCYLNLYTFPENELQRPNPNSVFNGWYPAPYANNDWVYQTARGAQGLVFHKQAVIHLLGSSHIPDRVQDKHNGWRSIDGAVGVALNSQGWKECLHYPSLLQHTGTTCSFNKRPNALKEDTAYVPFEWHPTTLSQSFKGEEFDCLTLLGGHTC